MKKTFASSTVGLWGYDIRKTPILRSIFFYRCKITKKAGDCPIPLVKL